MCNYTAPKFKCRSSHRLLMVTFRTALAVAEWLLKSCMSANSCLPWAMAASLPPTLLLLFRTGVPSIDQHTPAIPTMSGAAASMSCMCSMRLIRVRVKPASDVSANQVESLRYRQTPQLKLCLLLNRTMALGTLPTNHGLVSISISFHRHFCSGLFSER